MGHYLTADLIDAVRENIRRHSWAQAARDRMVEAARPWLAMSSDDLWDLMFGPTISRSWMVWSNGFCPSCRAGVPMYEWIVRPHEVRWKVRCPRCGDAFPTNDFDAYYRSGRDEAGVFDPSRADRSLLFNAAHPEAGDPLRSFGVDDGEGFVDGDRRWRFVGAYLVYGQWKQLVVGGITALSEAAVVTGDPEYARRAGVLLHRVADLYPSHDFERQGLAYEKGHGSGYVSTWHDACAEARALALAYDAVAGPIAADVDLAAFLHGKAARWRGVGDSGTPAEVARHIERGILRDTLANTKKITSNFPQTDITRLVILGVLGEAGTGEWQAAMDAMVEASTAVDGVTGEKGMTAYTAGAVAGMAELLALEERARPGVLVAALGVHPRLRDLFRFHLDTWCLGRYYPNSGDSGWFAGRHDTYAGVHPAREIDLRPSLWTFLGDLAAATHDPAYLQAIYAANDRTVEGLPYDLCAKDTEALARAVRDAVDRLGAEVRLPSVRKDAWRVHILRSGSGDRARAAWVTSRVGGNHKHFDGMHLGLFARGLDLLPDFGYPPVNYGGWGSPRALWYRTAASHNTVLVDGGEQRDAVAATTLWADGRTLKAMRFSSPEMVGASRYERAVLLVDVSEETFYLVDLFRVTGGREHCYTLHAAFGTARVEGAAPIAAGEADVPAWQRTLPLRGLACDRAPHPGWSVEWRIEDRFGCLPAGADTRLRCTVLTEAAEAWTGEAWISVRGFRNEEAWIPRMTQRRVGDGGTPLESLFVNVLEPHGGQPVIRSVRRLSDARDAVALSVELADGSTDTIVAADSPGATRVPSAGLATDGELCLVRTRARRAGPSGLSAYALASGSFVEAAGTIVRLATRVDLAEGGETHREV